MSPRRVASVLLPAAVSAALVWLLMRGISWSDLALGVARAPRKALALYALAALAGLVLRAVRFQLLLPRPRPAFAPVLLVTAVQHCLGDLVPARVAAFGSHVYLLVRRLAVGLEPAAASYLLAFVFDLATLGPLLAIAALVQVDAASLSGSPAFAPGWIVAAGAGFFLAAVVVLLELAPITGLLGRLVRGSPPPEGAPVGSRRQRLAARLDALTRAMAEVKRAGTLVPVFLVSLGIRLMKYASLSFLMLGLLEGAGVAGRRPDFWELVLGVTATEFVASLPLPVLGQFGVWEGGMAGALLLLGYDRGLATLAAVGTHAVTQAFEYLLGGLALAALTVSASRSLPGGRPTTGQE